MHLAELNIGKFKHPTSDPGMADFMNNLDCVNALAERSEGFVWRLKSDGSNNATDLRVGDDYAVNMSVWETPAALENYVFKTVHVQFYKRKQEFFDFMEKPHMVLWWISEGHTPTLYEAMDKLHCLEISGATERAFSWPELMDIERMRKLRCA